MGKLLMSLLCLFLFVQGVMLVREEIEKRRKQQRDARERAEAVARRPNENGNGQAA